MTTHIVNLFKGSYLNTLQIHTFNDSGQNVLYNFSEATNSGYAIYDDAGTTKGQLFTTADNGTTWVPTPNSEISSLNNNYGSNFDLSNLSTNNANIAGTTNYDDGGSDMSGTFEIFSSDDLSNHINVTFADSSALISGKYYSISPTDNGFDLLEWKLESGQWKTEGSPVAGYAPYADEAAMTAAFEANNVSPQATIHMNTDTPANLFSASDLTGVGVEPLSDTAPFSDSANTGYAVFTDDGGTTTILKYLKDAEDNWNLDTTAPNPLYASGSQSLTNSIPVSDVVGTGDVPDSFPVGVYSTSDVKSLFAEIPDDTTVSHFAIRESHDNKFMLQPIKIESSEFVTDGNPVTSATAFAPSHLGNVYPAGSWTQQTASADDGADDGAAADGANADDGANANANQDSIFGKVYQIDQSHLDNIFESGHSLSPGMDYTFMMNDQNELIILRVSEEYTSNNKYIPDAGSPNSATLKSSYNSEELLSAYIEGTTSGFDEIGSMLKRVDATDSNATIDLDDPDFEEAYSGDAIEGPAHSSSVQMWSLTADSITTGLPNVDGIWIAHADVWPDNSSVFTKVISNGDFYVPDPAYPPIIASDSADADFNIHTNSFIQNEGSDASIGTISRMMSGNIGASSEFSSAATDAGNNDIFYVYDTGSSITNANGNDFPIMHDNTNLFTKIGENYVNLYDDTLTGIPYGENNINTLSTTNLTEIFVREMDNNDTYQDVSLDEIAQKLSGINQPIEKLSVNIVIPLSDKFDYGEGYDNRSNSSAQINSLAFVPAGDKFYIFDDIYVSFENNFNGNLDKVSFKLTNAQYYTDGSSHLTTSNEDFYYNLVGNFEDLSNGGSLDLYMPSAWNDSNSDGQYNFGEEIYNPEFGSNIVEGVSVPQAASVGTSVIQAGGQIILPGGTNGYTAGAGDDYVMMNVSAISSYSGEFIGGDGWDYLDIKSDTGGMIVDFLGGNQGDPNSAFVTWSEGGNTGFVMSDFEAMFLSHGNDVAMIGADVGENLTDKFDADHFIGSQSMFRLETGNAEWDSVNNTLGTDYLYVNSDSNIYLSFNFAYDGVKATFNEDASTSKQSAVISNTNINTYVDEIDGTGQLVDAIKTTGYNDMVINNGSTGITVDLGGTNYEYEHTSESDVFIGSASSNYDILDAREAFDFTFTQTTINNPDTSQDIEGVKVSGNSEIGNVIDADLANVDYIMVRDESGDMGSITDDDLIWNSMATADVDFYKDMSDIYGQYQIEGLGSLTSDSYGQGYDVQTSASVENFGGETKRIYYDGNHSDFIDTTDRFSGEEGVFSMQLDTSGLDSGVDPYAIGSNWAKEVEESNPNGGEGSFYIVVGGKKVAVAHDGNGWKVDNTALFIAENASASITGPTNLTTFTQDVADRYNIQYDGSDGTITNDIYLNATEQQIDEVLASPNGLVSSAQAFNFGFYTQFQIGETTLNIKLQQDTPPSEDVIAVNQLLGDVTGNIVVRGQEGSYELYYVTGDGSTATPFVVDGGPIAKDTSSITAQNIITWKAFSAPLGYQGQVHYPAEFSVNEDDIDLMVESVFNRVETDGAGVSSGGEVGNFVKVDNVSDIALGNGGNDTYVIESSTMGTALEYGDINESVGGLDNSDADSVNFSGIATAAELNFSRGSIKNEDTDSTLIISDGTGSSTYLFDNYNTYFDFRRVEYLTVDDAANNDEIFEISVDGNLGNDDGTNKDLEWDNEIVVAKRSGDTIYADGGTDILVGGDGVDVFNLENVVGGTDHDTMSHVHIKNFSADDSIVMEATDTYTDTVDNGIITVNKSDGSQYMIFTDDETMLKTYIDTALGIA